MHYTLHNLISSKSLYQLTATLNHALLMDQYENVFCRVVSTRSGAEILPDFSGSQLM